MSENRVIRPWGWYESITSDEGYQVKRISVNPQSILSLQKHFKRSEHWTMVQGIGHVTKNDEIIELKADESVYLPVECIHRIENRSETEQLTFIEVQCGSYLGEDDIVRLEDVYGRV